jgi:hypothetical protein
MRSSSAKYSAQASVTRRTAPSIKNVYAGVWTEPEGVPGGAKSSTIPDGSE